MVCWICNSYTAIRFAVQLLGIACELFIHTYIHILYITQDTKKLQVIIIIIIIIISFTQGIYTYIPETNYVPREHSVAAILLLLFMVLISSVSVLNLLYFYISTIRSMCAVPNMAVFCSSWTSCFPGTLLTYFLNDFETVPVATVITGITFVFTFHMRCISIIIIIIIIIIINLQLLYIFIVFILYSQNHFKLSIIQKCSCKL